MSKIYTIIAAGGLGTRLQHYDDSKKTKMLLEINGESMITKQISQLMSWNLEKFIVITNPNVDKLIKTELKDKMPDDTWPLKGDEIYSRFWHQHVKIELEDGYMDKKL